MTKPLDRGAAVNLARNIHEDGYKELVTAKGQAVLVDAVLRMDEELKRLYAQPAATIALLFEALACMERHHHTTDLMRKVVCDKIRNELKRHTPQSAPLKAHSKTQYKRLKEQGANVLPPDAPDCANNRPDPKNPAK